MNAVTVHNLSVDLDRVPVLREVSCAVQAAGWLALIGPNGAGKTTLLRAVAGLLPHRGTIQVGHADLGTLRGRGRARLIAYVPQVHASTFAFSVETIVVMGRIAHTGLLGRPSAADHAVARRMLERFDIVQLADRPYPLISGGERQLTLLARALAQEPRCIVLDEPTASLDFGNQGKVLREMRALAAAGLGILFTTHDPNHAIRAADRAS